jgi:hypothetical protein
MHGRLVVLLVVFTRLWGLEAGRFAATEAKSEL